MFLLLIRSFHSYRDAVLTVNGCEMACSSLRAFKQTEIFIPTPFVITVGISFYRFMFRKTGVPSSCLLRKAKDIEDPFYRGIIDSHTLEYHRYRVWVSVLWTSVRYAVWVIVVSWQHIITWVHSNVFILIANNAYL